MSERRLMLLDTAALYFRAFYGVPDTVRAPDGTPVNAVRGLLDMITRLVVEYRPSDLIACWDDDWRPQWRVDLLPSYKTHRVAETAPEGTDTEVVPDPLSVQVPIIRASLDALRIPIVGAAHHEADDVIGSLCAQSRLPVDVVTGDRDLFQVIDDARSIRVISTIAGMSRLEVVTEQVVLAKYGVSPTQYADFALMRGDPSDGLPGVAGIGTKTAADLLRRFGDVAGILAAVDDADAGIPTRLRLRLRESEDYLERAGRVVRVVPDLALPEVEAGITVSDETRAALEDLGVRWGLGGAVRRVLSALSTGTLPPADSPASPRGTRGSPEASAPAPSLD